MERLVFLITLGPRGIDTPPMFYESPGWARVDSPDEVIASDWIAQTAGLCPLATLAEEPGVPERDLGRGALTVSRNMRVQSDAAPLLDRAVAAVARLIKPVLSAFWGGPHCDCAAPEGHIREITWAPQKLLRPNGAVLRNGVG